MTASSKMKDFVGTVNVARHKKTSNTDILNSIGENRYLQAFQVFAEDENKIIQNETYLKKHNSKEKKTSIFKDKDLMKYGLSQDPLDGEIIEKSYKKISTDALDISQLHKNIEQNNNCKYEINNEPSYNSFASDQPDVNENEKKTEEQASPSASWKKKQKKNEKKFTSENVFRYLPGDEIQYNISKNKNIFATILHDHLGSLTSLHNEDNKKNNKLSSNEGRCDRSLPEFENANSKSKNENENSTLEVKQEYLRAPEVENNLSSSPKEVTFKSEERLDSTDYASSQERKTSSSSEISETKTKSYSETLSDAIQNSWRRLSSVPRKSSSSTKPSTSSNPVAIDFGSCVSPEIRKFSGLTDKLHTWAHRNNINKRLGQKRNKSMSETSAEPAQRILVQNLKRQQRKSEEQQKDISSSRESLLKKSNDFVSYNISLEREIVNEYFLEESDFSMTSNIWYYGELDISLNTSIEIENESENSTSSSEEEEIVTGTLLVLLDQCQHLYYNLTYNIGNKLYVGSIPFESGKYSMDFSNPEQPRFRSIKLLIAHLIEQNCVFRAPFNWLLDNLPYTQIVELGLEEDWGSDGSEIL